MIEEVGEMTDEKEEQEKVHEQWRWSSSTVGEVCEVASYHTRYV